MSKSPVHRHSASATTLGDHYGLETLERPDARGTGFLTGPQMRAALDIERNWGAHANAVQFSRARTQLTAGLLTGAVITYPLVLLIIGTAIGMGTATKAYVLTMVIVLVLVYTPLGHPLIRASSTPLLSTRQNAVQRRRCLHNAKLPAVPVANHDLYRAGRRIRTLSADPTFILWEDYDHAARQIHTSGFTESSPEARRIITELNLLIGTTPVTPSRALSDSKDQ